MKIDRKKFFLTAAGTAFLGMSLLRNFPLKMFGKIQKSRDRKLKVKIHPLAVSRKGRGGNVA
jgi:hypothetical protein